MPKTWNSTWVLQQVYMKWLTNMNDWNQTAYTWGELSTSTLFVIAMDYNSLGFVHVFIPSPIIWISRKRIVRHSIRIICWEMRWWHWRIHIYSTVVVLCCRLNKDTSSFLIGLFLLDAAACTTCTLLKTVLFSTQYLGNLKILLVSHFFIEAKSSQWTMTVSGLDDSLWYACIKQRTYSSYSQAVIRLWPCIPASAHICGTILASWLQPIGIVVYHGLVESVGLRLAIEVVHVDCSLWQFGNIQVKEKNMTPTASTRIGNTGHTFML